MFISEERLKSILHAERETLLGKLMSLLTTRQSNQDKKLTAKEAASFLGISLSTLYKNIRHLPHRKFGKKLVFSLSELHQFDFASLPARKAKVD